MTKTIVVSIKVDVDDDKDFEIGKLFESVREYANKILGSTCWKYHCELGFEYSTEYKNIYCDECGGIYTHISEQGKDFKCLKCESKMVRESLK